jgi:hypothetical protein
MALDAYVMPLWRFKAGDFSSPIESVLGIEPTIVAPTTPEPGPPWYLRLLEKLGIIEITNPPPEPTPEEARAQAIKDVETLKSDLSKLAAKPIEWNDDGGVHYNKQFHDPTVLKAFAKWYDHRSELPEFLAPPELRYWEHPVWDLPRVENVRFPVLSSHSMHTGYFIAVEFSGIHRVEPFKSWGGHELFHDVASTQVVLAELKDLLSFLATLPEKKEETHGSSPIGDAKCYAEELQRICLLSQEHNLPVIFWG